MTTNETLLECPNCNQLFLVNESNAQEEIACPDCGAAQILTEMKVQEPKKDGTI